MYRTGIRMVENIEKVGSKFSKVLLSSPNYKPHHVRFGSREPLFLMKDNLPS